MSALPTTFTKTLGIFGSDEWLVASEIGVDMQYQRPLNMGHVRKIAKEFNLKAFGVLLVSERANGTYWIIDGQHRLAAVKAMGRGDMRLPCHVYRNLSVSEEAEIFHMQTQRRHIHPVDRFRARLLAGDDVAISVNRIIQKHGLQVETNTRRGTLPSIAAIERIYRDHGPQRLDDVIGLAVAAWGDRESGIPGMAYQGIDSFLNRYGDAFDRTRLMRVMRASDFERLTADTKTLRSAFRQSNPGVAFGRVLHALYNQGLRTNRLPDWDSVNAMSIAAQGKRRDSAGRFIND